MLISKKCPAFTLIEILVATTIFSLLMSIGVASYLNISKTLKEQNSKRKLYTEISYVLDDIHRLGKFFTIDYQWYQNNVVIDSSEGNEELVLINKGKTNRIFIKKIEAPTEEEKQNISLGIYKEKKDEYDLFTPEDGFEKDEFQPLTSDTIIIDQVRFFITPDTEEGVFHPKVTIAIQGKIKNPFKTEDESFSLQTTFSPRSYIEI